MPLPPAEPIPLLPRPTSVHRLEGWRDVPPGLSADDLVRALADPLRAADSLRGILDASVSGGWCGSDERDAQSYELVIAPDRPICARAPATPGLRHALATLAQLLRLFPTRLPALRVTDRPAVARRGVMLDVSRDRIPTMPEFARIIDTLAALKVNHLQLYTEHAFAYAGHEDARAGCDPLTPDEARALDAACRARGIELAANQNCFGHLKRWLELPRYAPLAETHGEWMFDVWPRRGPFSLCPVDPLALDLVRDLLAQLLPCFESPLVNIGCDETYDVGFGRSRDAVAARGKPRVFADFVSAIAAVVRGHGKRPMCWADFPLAHPEAFDLLPSDIVPIAWGYEPDSPFDAWGASLARWRDAGSGEPRREFWLAPGTSSWRSITGRTSERRANLAAAARAAERHAAAGLLACDWGDTGHHQQWPIAMHALAHAADAAWIADASTFDPRAAAIHALHAPPDLGPWLESLGDADLQLRDTCLGLSRPGRTGRLLNQSALFIDLTLPLDASRDVGPIADWDAARDRLADLDASRPHTGDALLDAELAHTLAVARLAADRAFWRRAPTGLSDAQRRHLADRLRDVMAEHARLWRLRSREGGLSSSLAHYHAFGKGILP